MLIKTDSRTISKKPTTCGVCEFKRSFVYYDQFFKQERTLWRCGHPNTRFSEDQAGRATAIQPSQPPPEGFCPYDYGETVSTKPLTMFGMKLPPQSSKLIADLCEKHDQGKL